MLKSKLNQLREKDGFTIIEVIIVLVIAAIIMLAVFLVVPQLQRTQRNSRRQNDARRVITTYEQYKSENNGTAPTTAGNITGLTGALTDPSGTAYNITIPATAAPSPPVVNTITVVPNNTCTNAGVLTASNGSVAVFVTTESAAGAPTNWCTNS